MPPSQLKQLKSSLRDNGILGPQKSKKQRKASNKDASKRLQRNNALEAKAPARREKFDIASNKPTKRTVERPGVTRGLGEERRRATLLKEMQSRNKVGGMLDRRFGEDDPDMTPEQKAAERFAQQALRQSRKNSAFNLEEDDDEEALTLTHGGRTLSFGDERQALKDDFQEELSASDADDFDAQDDRPRKRVRLETEDGNEEEEEENDVPQRKKTKAEVMQEVMAKSKAYKAARQARKEDDDELRAEIDKGLGDVVTAMMRPGMNARQLPSPPITDSEPTLNPSRAAMLAGKSRKDAEKEYEANVRQMAMDARSAPTVRTKSDEEKAAEEKARLEDLERKRLRRMKGEADSSEDESETDHADNENEEERDDAEAFGLEQPEPRYIPNLAVEDEDEFVMDDIIASDSEAGAASDLEDDAESTSQESEDDGDDDFINGLVLPKQSALSTKAVSTTAPGIKQSLPFTFTCPQSLDELESEMSKVKADGLSTAVQRIRALYHKGLAQENEEKLGNFAQALIPWISALVNNECSQKPSMQIIEQLLRHVHSLAKTHPHAVAAGFREYLRQFLDTDRRSLNAGDMIVLTSVSRIFPTSDLWHSVVTPALLVLTRYLGQASMDSVSDLAIGVYACSLVLNFQSRSRRYVPEAITFICKALRLLIKYEQPLAAAPPTCTTPTVPEQGDTAISGPAQHTPAPRLKFEDLRKLHQQLEKDVAPVKKVGSITPDSLLSATLELVNTCIDYYSDKTAYPEMMAPIQHLLNNIQHQKATSSLIHNTIKPLLKSTSTHLETTIQTSLSTRKPLLLHNHKPLAIKSSYPLFDDNYNPTRKQRDPDEERAELNKLKAEHKKERKGAMRELRKDANFVAREQLKEKKAKDEAYEKKFKRLVAEIQGEEGRESKDYAREKAKRTGRF